MQKKVQDSNKSTTPVEANKSLTAERFVKISKPTAKDPYNEYEENPLLMYSAFPAFFSSAKEYNNKALFQKQQSGIYYCSTMVEQQTVCD